MAEEYSLFDYPVESEPEQELQPLWKRMAKPEVKDPVVVDDPAPDGSCEFVGKPLYPGASSRMCMFYGACSDFDKPDIYVLCPTRKEKLKLKEQS